MLIKKSKAVTSKWWGGVGVWGGGGVLKKHLNLMECFNAAAKGVIFISIQYERNLIILVTTE